MNCKEHKKSPILPGEASNTTRQPLRYNPLPQKFNNSLVRDITSKAFAVKTAFGMLATSYIRHTKGCFHCYHPPAVPISARPRSAVYDNARRCSDCAQMRTLDPPSLALLRSAGLSWFSTCSNSDRISSGGRYRGQERRCMDRSRGKEGLQFNLMMQYSEAVYKWSHPFLVLF